MKRVVVAYDVSNDHSRKKVADLLEGIMERVQWSVFEGEPPKAALERVIERALSYIDSATDSLRVYHLCAACSPKVDVYGRGSPAEPNDVRIL